MADEPSNENLLTVGEAADHLGMSKYLVRQWAERGELRGFRTPGGQWRFRRRHVTAFADHLSGRDHLPGGIAEHERTENDRA